MSNAVQKQEIKPSGELKKKLNVQAIQDIFIRGDISKMNEIQKCQYIKDLCEEIGVSPRTQPFGLIEFKDGKEQLYATKNCAEQLRNLHQISLSIVSKELSDGIYTVVARATMPDERSDEDFGCVFVGHAKGETLANLMMKALTKAKRRVTLSICGLGCMDELEAETVPDSKMKTIDIEQPSMEGAKQIIAPKSTPTPSNGKIIGVASEVKATEKQLKFIRDLMDKKGATQGDIESILGGFNKINLEDITMGQAKTIIDALLNGEWGKAALSPQEPPKNEIPFPSEVDLPWDQVDRYELVK